MLCITLAACPSGKTAVPSAPPLASRTPVEIFNAALDAARAAGSLHAVLTYPTGRTDSYDITTTGGRVVVGDIPYLMEIRLVGSLLYVKANLITLLAVIGAPQRTAIKFTDRWIAFARTDPRFPRLSTALTLKSLIDLISFNGLVSISPQALVNGQKTIGISGTLSRRGAGTLYIALAGNPYPVEEIYTIRGRNYSLDFYKWGEKVNVVAPGGAVGASSIGL
jgi:hypothetical protein